MSYITPDTVADQLGVTAKTVREWLKSKTLIGVKLGGSWKIHQQDLDRFVDGQRLHALIAKASETYPETDWEGDQCGACGELIPVPSSTNRLTSTNWVCTVACKKVYDNQFATVVDRNTDDFAFHQGKVIPHF